MLTKLDPTGLGGKKGERERKRKEERSLKREALPSLYISRRSVRQIPARQEAKLIPTVRATRGYRYCGVLTNFGR